MNKHPLVESSCWIYGEPFMKALLLLSIFGYGNSLSVLHQSYTNPDNGIPPGSLGFPNGSAVKNLPPMQETRVWSLGQEDPLEKERATHSSILAWEIPGTEEPGGLQSTGLQRLRNNWANKPQHKPGSYSASWLSVSVFYLSHFIHPLSK